MTIPIEADPITLSERRIGSEPPTRRMCRLHANLYNIDVLRLIVEDNAVLLPVKIVPGASRTRFLGEWDGRARIAVAAPPEKGRANRAVLEFLAKRLGVAKKNLSVVAGLTTPLKTIRIDRVTADAVRAALSPGRS